MIIDYERLGAFTIHDFCKLYGLGRSKAYQILNAGQIHARKAGKITLIDKASAERWFQSLPSYQPSRRAIPKCVPVTGRGPLATDLSGWRGCADFGTFPVWH